jgi:metal-responsive CopG/Arc/MetJ family transcriptional regulator
MAKSKSVARKKTRRPTAQHPVKSLRLPADLAERIDRWAKTMGKDSHSEAMRHLLEIGLSAPKRARSRAKRIRSSGAGFLP